MQNVTVRRFLPHIPSEDAYVQCIQHLLMHRFVDGLNPIRIVDGHGGIREVHCWAVNAAVDDHQRVKVQDESFPFHAFPGTVLDPLVLLLEEGSESWTISTAVGFSGQADARVVGMVAGEFLEPSLCKVPESMRGIDASVRSLISILRRISLRAKE